MSNTTAETLTLSIDGIYAALRADLSHAQNIKAVERALSGHFAGAYHLCIDAQTERDPAMALDSAREIISTCVDDRWSFDFDDEELCVRNVETISEAQS